MTQTALDRVKERLAHWRSEKLLSIEIPTADLRSLVAELEGLRAAPTWAQLDELNSLRRWRERVYPERDGEPDWMTEKRCVEAREALGTGSEALDRYAGAISTAWAVYSRLALDEVRRELEGLRAGRPQVPRSVVLDEEWALYEREPTEGERSVLMTFKSEHSAVEYMADQYDEPEDRPAEIVPVYFVRRNSVSILEGQ